VAGGGSCAPRRRHCESPTLCNGHLCTLSAHCPTNRQAVVATAEPSIKSFLEMWRASITSAGQRMTNIHVFCQVIHTTSKPFHVLQVILVVIAAQEDAASWKEDTHNASLSIIIPVSVALVNLHTYDTEIHMPGSTTWEAVNRGERACRH